MRGVRKVAGRARVGRSWRRVVRTREACNVIYMLCIVAALLSKDENEGGIVQVMRRYLLRDQNDLSLLEKFCSTYTFPASSSNPADPEAD
jgi:hypothetical protein